MTLSPRRAASYRLSLRLLLSPARLRESLTTLQPQPSLRNATIAGAQVALALVLVAAALHPSPWQHVLGFACLGTLAALFGRCATVAQRRRIVLIAGALLLGPVAVLSWLSWLGLPTLALLLALAAITGVIPALAHRLQTGGAGGGDFHFCRQRRPQPCKQPAIAAGTLHRHRAGGGRCLGAVPADRSPAGYQRPASAPWAPWWVPPSPGPSCPPPPRSGRYCWPPPCCRFAPK